MTSPLMKIFKEQYCQLDVERPWDRRDALRLISVFDVEAGVLHHE
jgi:hypothetical protein